MISQFLRPVVNLFYRTLDLLTPLVDLTVRSWIAWAFFKSGWLKLQSWQSTLFLFEHEFKVPLLSGEIAAYLGTAAELILPVLLVLGLGGRFITFLFFMLNLIATISYPHLWTSEGAQGLMQHVYWGFLLAYLTCHGTGKLALDYWLEKKWCFSWGDRNKK